MKSAAAAVFFLYPPTRQGPTGGRPPKCSIPANRTERGVHGTCAKHSGNPVNLTVASPSLGLPIDAALADPPLAKRFTGAKMESDLRARAARFEHRQRSLPWNEKR